MDRRKTGDILFYALQCAKSDRQAFMDAFAGIPNAPEIAEARADIKAFERVQRKLFGTTRSKLDAAKEAMQPVTMWDVRQFIKDNPHLVDEGK